MYLVNSKCLAWRFWEGAGGDDIQYTTENLTNARKTKTPYIITKPFDKAFLGNY